MYEKTGNAIVDLSFEFALLIVAFCEKLEDKRKYVIARQLLKSGTSIGANVRESQSAESKADFSHKLKIADKEANESEYWLLICKHSEKYPYDNQLMDKLISIKKLLSKIISTSKRRG